LEQSADNARNNLGHGDSATTRTGAGGADTLQQSALHHHPDLNRARGPILAKQASTLDASVTLARDKLRARVVASPVGRNLIRRLGAAAELLEVLVGAVGLSNRRHGID
jgi:hypothetical protein